MSACFKTGMYSLETVFILVKDPRYGFVIDFVSLTLGSLSASLVRLGFETSN